MNRKRRIPEQITSTRDKIKTHPKAPCFSLNEGYPVVTFRYRDENKYTFLKASFEDLKSFLAFVFKLEKYTWQQIYETAGKEKSGFGYTPVPKDRLPNLPSGVPDDATVFELRVNQKARVFAFRGSPHRGENDFCCVIWYDTNHDICS